MKKDYSFGRMTAMKTKQEREQQAMEEKDRKDNKCRILFLEHYLMDQGVCE